MASHIDEVFSVDRLRRNWQRGGTGTEIREEKAPDKSATREPTAVYEELRRLIEQRFPGNLNRAMDLMLDQLREYLVKRFPPEGETDEAPEEEKALLDAAIEKTLDRIEDLFEALELADGGPK